MGVKGSGQDCTGAERTYVAGATAGDGNLPLADSFLYFRSGFAPAEEERANAWILLMPLPREEVLSSLINSRLCYIVMEDRRNRKKGEGFFTAIFS